MAREWRPPTPLVDFLNAGPAPVFIGFGSTATAHGDELSDKITHALRRSRVRGVVQAGWAGLCCTGDDILTIEDVPHAWLFPRMAAVVHHCGAGTAAAALRAGVPSVPVAGIVDQPFWAHRLHNLDVATRPLRRSALSADDLAAAITLAVTSSTYRTRAQHFSRLLADEDGAANAVGVIASQLGIHSTTEVPDGH